MARKKSASIRRALRHPDIFGAGAKKRRKLRKKKNKVHVVMSEFKRGTLYSGTGKKVTSRDQAVAIALSEAGLSRGKRSRKKRRKK